MTTSTNIATFGEMSILFQPLSFFNSKIMTCSFVNSIGFFLYEHIYTQLKHKKVQSPDIIYLVCLGAKQKDKIKQ